MEPNQIPQSIQDLKVLSESTHYLGNYAASRRASRLTAFGYSGLTDKSCES